MVRQLSDREKECLIDERQFLHQEMDRCGYCNDNYDNFSRCWHESAHISGTRSRGCLL